MTARTAAIIGAGFGGLALAIRLQSAGVETTLIEARDQPGGRAGVRVQDGFTFDLGPQMISDPDALQALWALTGRSLAEDVTLRPVRPFYRLHWPDGTQFDYSNDEVDLRAEIARLNPVDLQGYEKFLDYAAGISAEFHEKPEAARLGDWRAALGAVPALGRYQAWRSVYASVARFIAHEKLREALSFHVLRIGGNPMTASAINAHLHILEKMGGLWCAEGGTGALIRAMIAHFERLGGTLRLGDRVAAIDTLGDRVTGVTTASGAHVAAQAVASNADIVHSYRDLLPRNRRGERMAERLERKRWSPSLFLVHFGLRGSWPGIPHHMVLFGQRYRELWTDIFDHGVLPQDTAITLHHPTITDPSLAPEGCSSFTASVPVPHLGKLPVDWKDLGAMLEKRILDEIGRRLIPDVHQRIVTRFRYTPEDFARDLGSHHGSAWSLEPVPAQSAWFRVQNRDPVIPNLYFVGAGTHPGAGIPGVLASARTTAGLMLEDLRV